MALGLLGLNAWWFWVDRPPQDMATIDAWLRTQRDEQAEQALRSLLVRSPSDGDARMKLARLLGKQEDYLGCALQLQQVPKWWPTRQDALFLQAQAFKLANRARDAEQAWKACLEDDPLHPTPLRSIYAASRELVGIYVVELRLDEAREALMEALERAEPADRAGILVLRMQVELNRIHPEVAAETLRGYVEADPDDWQARRALARQEQENNDPAEADRQIAICLEARPEEPIVWRTYLEILHQRGDRERFQEAVRRLPSSADGDAEIWKYRGLARVQEEDFERAAEAFAEAIRLAPFESEYHYRLAINANRLGQPDRAKTHLRRHEELKEARSQISDALNAYLEVFESSEPDDPEFRIAVERLAFICEQLGWDREARSWASLLPEEARGPAPPADPQS